MGSIGRSRLRVVLTLLTVVVALVILDKGVSDARDGRSRRTITPAQFRSIHKGMTLTQVRAKLGRPGNAVHTDTGGKNDSDCLFYSRRTSEVSPTMYQFCFLDGRLTSKSSF